MDVLTGDVLLIVFDFYLEDTHQWKTLVHVCRRWRSIVFGSPRRLNLKLRCTHKTPTRDMLDVWPPLPLLIQGHIYENSDVNNVIAALERSDRVSETRLYAYKQHKELLEKVLAAMQEPFHDLTILALDLGGMFSPERFTVNIPDSFLSGSAPRLRVLKLNSFSFPGLPKLLLSATHLVHLSLSNLPDSGYISPETIANWLSALTCLERLRLCFGLPPPLPDFNQESRHSPPQARTILPFLTSFKFQGADRYLEDLVTLIDAPQLDKFRICFSHRIDFDTSELLQFISRTPRLTALDEARIAFRADVGVRVTLSSQTSQSSPIVIEFCDHWADWVLSSLTHFCASSPPLISNVENLYIYEDLDWQDGSMMDDDIEATDWMEVLRPFTSVKNLYLSGESVQTFADMLGLFWDEIGAEVLPDLQKIFLDKTKASSDVVENIGRFIYARRRMAASPSHEEMLEEFEQFKPAGKSGPEVNAEILSFLESRLLSGPTIAVSFWDVDWDEDEDGDSDEDKGEDVDDDKEVPSALSVLPMNVPYI